MKSHNDLLTDEVFYGIGIQKGNDEFGMTHGPNPDLFEMLDVIGNNGQFIIAFHNNEYNKVSYELLYKWENDEWIHINEPSHKCKYCGVVYNNLMRLSEHEEICKLNKNG